MLDDGTEDFYEFPDDWDEEEEQEAEEIDVDLRKIVVVDASAFHRNILKKQLEESGFKVIGVVGSAEEANPILEDATIRFAAVDLDQTDGGKAAVMRLISEPHPKTIFIMTSARITAGQLPPEMMSNRYFIPKPFQKNEVQEIMKKAYDWELNRKKAIKASEPKAAEPGSASIKPAPIPPKN